MGTMLAYLFVSAVMGVGIWRVVVWMKNAKKTQLTYTVPKFQYCAIPIRVAGNDADLVARLVNQSFSAITRHGPWVMSEVYKRVGEGTIVHVQKEMTWKNALGQTVGGELRGHTLLVTPNCDSLCHELVHLCEMVMDGQTDNSHASWVDRGLKVADQEYRQFLSMNPHIVAELLNAQIVAELEEKKN